MNGAKARNASFATQTLSTCQTTTPGSGAVRKCSGSTREAISPWREANVKACSGTSLRKRPAIHFTLR